MVPLGSSEYIDLLKVIPADGGNRNEVQNETKGDCCKVAPVGDMYSSDILSSALQRKEIYLNRVNYLLELLEGYFRDLCKRYGTLEGQVKKMWKTNQH